MDCCIYYAPNYNQFSSSAYWNLLYDLTEHGEGLQVLHYEVGQKYEAHYDYFLDEYNTKNGGQRTATVLMYL